MAGKRKLSSTGNDEQSRDPKRQKGMSSPSNKTKISLPNTFPGFLSLPSEIRQLILQQIVQSSEKIQVEHHTDRGLKVRKYAKCSLRRLHGTDYATLNRSRFAIVLSSRQMYLEASKLYYSLNTFQCSADGPDQLDMDEPGPVYNRRRYYQRFLAAIGPTNTASIAHISLIYSSRNQLLNLASLPSSLKTLHIRFDDHGHYIPTSLEEFVQDKVEVAVTVEVTRICCDDWSHVLDDFVRNFGLVRRDEAPNSYWRRAFLSRPGQNGKSAVAASSAIDTSG